MSTNGMIVFLLLAILFFLMFGWIGVGALIIFVQTHPIEVGVLVVAALFKNQIREATLALMGAPRIDPPEKPVD